MRGKEIILITMLLSLQCVQSTGPVVPELKVTVEDVSCVEAWLRVELKGGVSVPTFLVLIRVSGGREEERDTVVLYRSDTVMVDEGLLPGKEYRYCVQWAGKEQTVQVRTMDTTSHTIQWCIDTLGAVGIIRDVWILRRDLAYAVGEIRVRDSTGAIDWEHIYNAARWNGHEWELMRIPCLICGSNSYIVSPLYTIYAFNENDIWFSDGGEIIHWDGTKYTNDCSMNPWLTGAINKLWGISSRDLYAVGNNGLIAHYDGVKWERVESGTEVDLTDIYGIDGNHIWVAGLEDDYSRCVILYYDGRKWTNLYEGSHYGFNSVWTNTERMIYVTGYAGPYTLDMKTLLFRRLTTPARFVMYCVRGIGRNDIFYSDQNSEVTHFNGRGYHLYEDVQNRINEDTWWYSVKLREDFVLIGGGYYIGYNFAPIVLRGYR